MKKSSFIGGGNYYLLNNNTYYYLPQNYTDSNCVSKSKLKVNQLTDFLIKSKKRLNTGGKYNPNDILKAITNTQSVDFEVTQKCNLECAYCSFGKYYKRDRQYQKNDINIEYAYILIDFLCDHFNNEDLNYSFGKPIYFGFYGGEPLLNMPGIKKIVSYIENKTLKYNTTKYKMTTNGVLLDKNIEYLVEKNFNLAISLDGNQIHNGFRVFPDGTSSFKTVFNNIKHIQLNYPVFFENNVVFLTVLNSKSDKKDIDSFFLTNFNKTSKLSLPSVSDLNPEYKNEFFEKYYPVNPNIIELSEYYRFIKFYSNRVKRTYLDLFPTKNNNIKSIPTGTCVPFSKRVFITSDGKILPCEKIDHNNVLASVTKDRIEIDYLNITNSVNEKLEKLETLCSTCIKTERCTECLFFNEFKTKSVECKSYSNINEKHDAFFERITNQYFLDSKIYKQLINDYHEV